ncbi:UNKNOWN [Stylonychia lemnae]|uniref:Amino acid transporter transmembrane domain-containing protein n=1 Tax=Stylonychia lemnae TaxID=5949 RepID=A0A078A156_STYLE|nr:UNKNOWN [Stylonychia lemnae]|eukprot:CDW75582.1 UNKNOWN [Stylonychia lemnae]
MKKPSDFQLFMVSVKLFFGISYLSMPNTFGQTGLIGGILLFTVIITLNTFTMNQILAVSEQHHNIKSYSELGERIFGGQGRILLSGSIWIKQICACISYLYFIATQLDFVICQQSQLQYCYGNSTYMLLLIIPVIILSSIDSYKYLSYLSVPSVIIATIGMFAIFYYSFEQMAAGLTSQSPIVWFDLNGFFGRIGLAMYLFDGNAVVINIRAEARDKSKYPQILQKAVIFALLLFITFSTICYSVFREQSKPIFTMNLNPENALVIFIFICVCINALTSYPIQILAAFAIVEKHDFFKSESKVKAFLKKFMNRAFIIIVTTLISMTVPTFTDFLNIAGSIGSATVGFIFPQLLYMKQFPLISTRKRFICWLILWFGALGGSYSIYFSVEKLMRGDYS